MHLGSGIGITAIVAVTAVAPTAAMARNDGSKPASKAIVTAVTTVPVATFDAVGAGKISGPGAFTRHKLTGAPYTRGGKPVVLTGNLAWCPHCAANNWGLAVALSRFGTFSSLHTIDSGTYFAKHGGRPAFSHTRGISFFGTTFTSDYLVFEHLTVQDLKGRSLQKPGRTQARNLAFAQSYPAVNVGGVYGTDNSGFSPGALKGKSAAAIARALADPANPLSQRIVGLANFYSAAICATTGGAPAEVCTSPGVTAAQPGLPS